MKVFWDPAQLRHAPSFFLQRGVVKRYLETPDRAEALLAACHAMGLETAAPKPLGSDALLMVHDARYLAFLRDGYAQWSAQPDHGADMVPTVHPAPEMLEIARSPAAIAGLVGWFTADTSCPITADTWPAAQAAAACALAAAEAASGGAHAYALCRPPGHHAYPARAGGHCFLNNAALAAERLRARGAARVAVLDIDAHHGNGTQAIFWRRDDVLFASLHGDPAGYYPFYVGHAGEQGEAAGAGCNRNVPLPRDTQDAEWLAALDVALAWIARSGAEALVVSLGFDASVSEPLRFLSVSDDGFARAGERIAAAGLPCAIVQEGGYDVDALARLLRRFLGGFGG
jgi:acetoin utilization deacetylase AcuC-like enzyme